MPAARARKPKAKPAETVLDDQTRAKLKRDAQAVMRRYRQRKSAFDEVESERDRVIRSLMAAGILRAEIAELFELSLPRIDQIRTGRR